MNKAYKFRIYPNKEQEVLLLKTFGCCRKIWNLMLNDKIRAYEKDKTILFTTPAMYKEDYPYLREVDSLALANVQLNLQSAYRNCFDKTRVKRNGFPKFKSRKSSKNSYTTNNQKGSVKILDTKHIKLPKLGIIKAVVHRLPKDDWKLKSATISMTRDGKYYCSILFEYEIDIKPVKITNNVLGLDYKSDGLYMDSNGKIGTNHKFYRETHKKLAKEQRRLSRKKGSKKNEKKSKNYIEQLIKVNKIYRKISNQRLDNLHKISNEIANQYDVVCVENLDMKAMSNKGFGNGKATLDNGYGMFLNLLEYKLLDRGKHFVRIEKLYPSSQICSHCGNKQKLSLSERVYKCKCGLEIDRDLNAAINIKNEGIRLLNTA